MMRSIIFSSVFLFLALVSAQPQSGDPNDPRIYNLKPWFGSLSPAFSESTFTYTLHVSEAQSQLAFVYETINTYPQVCLAQITGSGGQSCYGGDFDQSSGNNFYRNYRHVVSGVNIPAAGASETYTITSTSQGSYQGGSNFHLTYTITVTTDATATSSANLGFLRYVPNTDDWVTEAVLVPSFSPTTYAYTATTAWLSYGITALPEKKTATLEWMVDNDPNHGSFSTVNPFPSLSMKGVFSVTGSTIPPHTIRIKVTDPDDTANPKTYVITCVKIDSDVALIGSDFSMYSNSYNLVPGYSPFIYTYDIPIPSGVVGLGTRFCPSISDGCVARAIQIGGPLTPLDVQDMQRSNNYNNFFYHWSDYSDQCQNFYSNNGIPYGDSQVVIDVKAQNGIFHRNYTFNFHRAHVVPSDARALQMHFYASNIYLNFSSDIYTYNLNTQDDYYFSVDALSKELGGNLQAHTGAVGTFIDFRLNQLFALVYGANVYIVRSWAPDCSHFVDYTFNINNQNYAASSNAQLTDFSLRFLPDYPGNEINSPNRVDPAFNSAKYDYPDIAPQADGLRKLYVIVTPANIQSTITVKMAGDGTQFFSGSATAANFWSTTVITTTGTSQKITITVTAPAGNTQDYTAEFSYAGVSNDGNLKDAVFYPFQYSNNNNDGNGNQFIWNVYKYENSDNCGNNGNPPCNGLWTNDFPTSVKLKAVATDSQAIVRLTVPNVPAYTNTIISQNTDITFRVFPNTRNTWTIKVTSPNGFVTKTYTFSADAPSANYSDINDVQIANDSPSPTRPRFVATTYDYDLYCPPLSNSLYIYFRTNNYNGNSGPWLSYTIKSGSTTTGPFDLDNGNNGRQNLLLATPTLGTYNITVTSKYRCSTSIYRFRVVRGPVSSEAHLESFTIAGSVLSPTFTPLTLIYTINIPLSQTDLGDADFQPVDPGATMAGATLNGQPIQGGIFFHEGTNTIDLTIIASDQVTTVTYHFIINRGFSGDPSSSGAGGGGVSVVSSSTGYNYVGPVIDPPAFNWLCQSLGDPHINVGAPGIPAFHFDCQTPGWVPYVYSTNQTFKIQVQQRRLFTGETPASNTGIDATSPLIDHFYLENGIFTIGTNQYTRTTLLTASDYDPYVGKGIKVSRSRSSQGAIIIEFTPYLTVLQLNFWNYNSYMFFDVCGTIPNTLRVNDGLCNQNQTAEHCPIQGNQNPEWLRSSLFFEEGIFGYRPKDDPAITPELIEQVCGALKDVSDFFYQACKYDVAGAKNPNIANVVIQSVNTVVQILTEQNVLENYPSVVNVTALPKSNDGTTITTIASVSVPNFPSISTEDVAILSSSSTGTLGGDASRSKPTIITILFVMAVSLVTFFYGRV